jgi:hypothetical protein
MFDLRKFQTNVQPHRTDPIQELASATKAVREFGTQVMGDKFQNNELVHSANLFLSFKATMRFQPESWASNILEAKRICIRDVASARLDLVAGTWANQKLESLNSMFEKQSFLDDMRRSVNEARTKYPNETELFDKLDNVINVLAKNHSKLPIVDDLGQMYLFDKWKAE